MKTFVVKNLGCKVNQYEGQAIREQLEKRGLREMRPDERCDLVIVNTCTVTSAADRKSRYEFRRFNRFYPGARIIATGCYAERDKEVLSKLDGVHAVVGQREKSKLLQYVDAWLREAGSAAEFIQKDSDLDWGISRFPGHGRAFIKIQDGCNKACTFCKVVIVRGGLKSRSVESVLEEAKRVLSSGYKEIVLAGIQLGAFGKDRSSSGELVELMKRLANLAGLKRIRLSSINPYDISNDLVELMVNEPKCCPHLHIPLQSGSNAVLESMKRGYTREFYLERVEKLRRSVTDFQLTLDLMVGFPGESESDFEETLQLLRQINPLKIHAFPFSPRGGTRATGFTGAVSKEVIQERVKIIFETGEALRGSQMRRYIGRRVSFLVEEFDEASQIVKGVTANYMPVVAPSRISLIGEAVESSVRRADTNLLYAELTKANLN